MANEKIVDEIEVKGKSYDIADTTAREQISELAEQVKKSSTFQVQDGMLLVDDIQEVI